MDLIERAAAYLPFVLAVLYLAMAAAAYRSARRWGAAVLLVVALILAATVASMGARRTVDELAASWQAQRGRGVTGTFVATEVQVDDATPPHETWVGTFSSDDFGSVRGGVRLDDPPRDMRPGTPVPALDTGATLAVYGYGPPEAFTDALISAVLLWVLLLAPGIWLAYALMNRRRTAPARPAAPARGTRSRGGDADEILDIEW